MLFQLTLNTPSQPVTGLGSIKFDGFVSCAIKYQSIPAASTSSDSGSGESNATDEDTSTATTQEQEVNQKEDSVESMSKSEVITLAWTTVGILFAAVFLAI